MNRSKPRHTASIWTLVVLVNLFAASTARPQLLVNDTTVGYIDSAVPATQFRLRFDAAYSGSFPDRIEFQYAKYNNPGAPLPETSVSHQELAAYFEYAPLSAFSMFVELPVRWINPDMNANTGGLYDMNAGAKLRLFETDNTMLSAQLRVYAATGDLNAGLSTGHASLEPALLYLGRLTERLTVEAEVRDWIPIDASKTGGGGGMGGGGGGGGGMGAGGRREFGGNMLRYGVGMSYLLMDRPTFDAKPVVELVGWHVFSGLKSDPAGNRISALNDSIANLKLGMRFGVKQCGPECETPDTLFVGYGTALTDQTWYQDVLRVEYRSRF